MTNFLTPLLIVSLLAPIRTVSPDATKNRKSQVSRQSKAKRTIKRRRGNIKRRNRSRRKPKYSLTRRRKAGGTITGHRNSRATTNTNKQVRKKSTNKVRSKHHVQHSTQQGNKGKPSKKDTRSRSPGHLSPFQREVLRYQMQILLSDPAMGPIYRQILRKGKKKK